jgi:transcriptional regulator with XRE-family HTH domain
METMTTALKRAIQRDGRTLAEIGRASDTDKSILSRFMRSERDMTLGTADRVCDALGVECLLTRQRSKGQTGRAKAEQ